MEMVIKKVNHFVLYIREKLSNAGFECKVVFSFRKENLLSDLSLSLNPAKLLICQVGKMNINKNNFVWQVSLLFFNLLALLNISLAFQRVSLRRK